MSNRISSDAQANEPSLRLPPLPAAEIARSPLRNRAVFVIDRTGTAAHQLLARAIEGRPGVSHVLSTGVFGEGVPSMIGNHQLSKDAGLGTLVPLAVLTAATRRLVDHLLGGGAGPDGFVIEHTGVSDTDPAIVRAIFPDATVVVVEDRPGADTTSVDLALVASDVRRSPGGAASAVLDAAQRRSRPSDAPVGEVGPVADDGLRDRLVLVFGVPRSGTTWLEQMLLAHSRTAGVAASETWIFRGIQRFWTNHEGGTGLHTAVNRAALAAALRRFCDELLLFRLRQAPGASHFVEKTPGHAWLLPWINAVYPDAWYVHIVRDGRDVSRSVAEMTHGTSDVRRAAAEWASTVLEVEARRPALARFCEVRYEDLLADPVAETAALLRWVGLDLEPSDIRAIRSEAAVRVSRHGTTGSVGAGKWATMTAAERRIVLATAGDVLTKCGYASPAEVRAARRTLRLPWGIVAETHRRIGLTPRQPARG